ncbi:hypothetical protein ACFQV2_33895 [Actinokineospora soli]|uniref:Uncharacterized protein n=1 Tax=Actinokineospora soli TaxID=1048753 RepID=A0ABW2TUW3_9PSEU
MLEFAERTATGTALRDLRLATRAVTERGALPDRRARLAAPPGGAARLVGAGVRDVSAEGRVALADPPKGGGESALVWVGDAEPLRADVQLDTGPRTATGLPRRG